MEFEHAYAKSSAVRHTAGETGVSFSPDLTREPTYFSGRLRESIRFREAISALHDVVVSDLRWKPKDREAYKRWAAENIDRGIDEMMAKEAAMKAEIDRLHAELSELQRKSHDRMSTFYRARQKYFDYLYQKDKDAWFVLDPVITVHPDQVFFECFSQDESTYGRLAASYEVFDDIGEHACGTTNVDYSQALYDEFQKIRTYKKTELVVDPGGFQVDTSGEPSYKELKIDLPESWVRGFLQVNSAMTFPAARVSLHPYDLHNLCFVLRRNKELKGPRSMRWRLSPGEPVRVLLEPWNIEVECPRSIYEGDLDDEIRTWGRRRIHTLERLIPIAKRIDVLLLGTGLPTFYVAHLGDMVFTLGLSGWTANDWSRAGNFDLMAPRRDVDELTKRRVFEGLKETWFAGADDLAKKLALDPAVVHGALSAYAQAGRVIYDVADQVYRVRELTKEPLPVDALRFANEREAAAARFVAAAQATMASADKSGGVTRITGTVEDKSKKHEALLAIDDDDRLVDGRCECRFYQSNKLFKGPCEHMLALRMVFERRRRVR